MAGALAAATRSLGFLVWLIVVYEWLSSHGWILTAARTPDSWRNLRAALRSDWPALLLICLIPLGLLAYMLYLALTFNVDNIFNQDPPGYNGVLNSLDGYAVSSIGRVVQFGVNKKF